VGGSGDNVTSLCRKLSPAGEPFRPIRYLTLDRDTPQVLVDGVALQQAGSVLGLEEFNIGTMSAWGRDVSHLRPDSFIVGRRDFLVSRAVGRGTLQDGQGFLEGANCDPERNHRIDGHSTGYVSAFVARPALLWQARHTYPGGDRLWQLDPTVIGSFGQSEHRLLHRDWKQVAADQPEKLVEQMVHKTLRPVSARQELAQGTFFYDADQHVLSICPYPGSEPVVMRWTGGRSDPVHLVTCSRPIRATWSRFAARIADTC